MVEYGKRSKSSALCRERVQNLKWKSGNRIDSSPSLSSSPIGIAFAIVTIFTMEEYDDLTEGPVEGVLNLSHNTWKTLPPELGDFSKTLLHLEMSNNNLSSIPSSIGNLILLKSLDVSRNQIEIIDGAIGKCIRLRKMNVAANRLECFPEEIGNCMMLVSGTNTVKLLLNRPTYMRLGIDLPSQEEIVAYENRLSTIPNKLENLIALSILDVRNNSLTSIPTKLCRVVSESADELLDLN